MSFARRLRSLIAGSTPRPAPARRPRARLGIESLEDRSVPAAGVLDPTFGTGGQVVTDFGGTDAASAAALDSAGRVVVAGVNWTQRPKAAVARYTPAGAPDPTFSGDGRDARFNFPARDVAVQPDGKAVVVGYDIETMAARYNADGSPDASFGKSGLVTTDVNGVRGEERADAVAVQPDGKILVAGRAKGGLVTVVRYARNGALDGTFGSGGKVTVHVPVSLYDSRVSVDVAVQPDGRIVLAAPILVRTPDGTASYGGPGFGVIRLLPGGGLDPSFGGGDGITAMKLRLDPIGDEYPSQVVVQADGKIVVAGTHYWSDQRPLGLARFNPDGSPDAGFGAGGAVVTTIPAGGDENYVSLRTAVALQADGRILATAANAGNTETGTPASSTLARFNPDGTFDASFDGDGKVSLPGFACGGLVVRPDGAIVLAGTNTRASGSDVWVARYLPSAPSIGSFASAPGPDGATALTAGNITNGNPGATITRVAFYVLNADGTRTLLGDGTRNADGTWALAVYLPPGTYTLLAEATDSYGVVGDPTSLSLVI